MQTITTTTHAENVSVSRSFYDYLLSAAEPITDADIDAVAREMVGASWDGLPLDRQDETRARVLDVLSALSTVRPALMLAEEGQP